LLYQFTHDLMYGPIVKLRHSFFGCGKTSNGEKLCGAAPILAEIKALKNLQGSGARVQAEQADASAADRFSRVNCQSVPAETSR